MLNSNVPVLFERTEECCGCSACFAACPVHAIGMKADEEGFLYPEIQEEICIRCGKCLQVCFYKVKKQGCA